MALLSSIMEIIAVVNELAISLIVLAFMWRITKWIMNPKKTLPFNKTLAIKRR